MKPDLRLLEKRAYDVRKQLGFDNFSPIDFDLLKDRLGDRITYVEYPLSNGFCGLIYKIDTDCALIVLNSKLTLGKQNFTFAHELYHFRFYSGESKLCPFNEGFNDDKKDLDEINADIFASFFLMPRFSFLDFFSDDCGNAINQESVIKLENHFHVNRYTVVSRLMHEFDLTNKEAKELLRIDKTLIASMNYPTYLYIAKEDCKSPHINGYYNNLAAKLFEDKKISERKYKEILDVFGTND